MQSVVNTARERLSQGSLALGIGVRAVRGVGSVLEGSIRKVGNKIRISVQFIDTLKEEPRWSQKYDREVKDVFAIQSEIAQYVAEALRDQVLGGTHRDRE